jgi:hypothetical protein
MTVRGRLWPPPYDPDVYDLMALEMPSVVDQ